MRRTPLRVDQSLVLISGTVLGMLLVLSCVLHGLTDWRQARDSREHHALAAARLVAPQAAPLLKRRVDGYLHDWIRTLQANPDVLLVAVHDKSGELRAIETNSPVLAKRAVWSKDVMAGLYTPRTWHIEDADGTAVCGAMVPIVVSPDAEPVGQLTMALAARDAGLAAVSPWWAYYLPLAMTAALLWWWSSTRMRRQVVEPFARLTRLAASASADLPVDREDPVGDLAKTFVGLRKEIDHWRDQAKRMEVTLERKIEHRTRGFRQQLAEIAREAETDPLTGLSNRRVLDAHLDAMVEAHRREGAPLSLVVMDVDNFKSLNDTLGHPAGDELLALAGKLLASSIREDDLAVRTGGDEFALILPGTPVDEAIRIAERVRALFGQLVTTLPPMPRPPGLSTGVADLARTGATTGRALLQAADEALYQAKQSGRSQVALARRTAAPTEA